MRLKALHLVKEILAQDGCRFEARELAQGPEGVQTGVQT